MFWKKTPVEVKQRINNIYINENCTVLYCNIYICSIVNTFNKAEITSPLFYQKPQISLMVMEENLKNI